MKVSPPRPRRRRQAELMSDVLILPDGRVLGHNLTPAFTQLLGALNPVDPQFGPRRNAAGSAAAAISPNALRRTAKSKTKS